MLLCTKRKDKANTKAVQLRSREAVDTARATERGQGEDTAPEHGDSLVNQCSPFVCLASANRDRLVLELTASRKSYRLPVPHPPLSYRGTRLQCCFP